MEEGLTHKTHNIEEDKIMAINFWFPMQDNDKIEVIVYNDYHVKIVDSYKVHKIVEMKDIIQRTLNLVPTNKTLKERSMISLISEWRAHNLLYELGIAKSRTKDINFKRNFIFILAIGYAFLSLFYPSL